MQFHYFYALLLWERRITGMGKASQYRCSEIALIIHWSYKQIKTSMMCVEQMDGWMDGCALRSMGLTPNKYSRLGDSVYEQQPFQKDGPCHEGRSAGEAGQLCSSSHSALQLFIRGPYPVCTNTQRKCHLHMLRHMVIKDLTGSPSKGNEHCCHETRQGWKVFPFDCCHLHCQQCKLALI